MLGLLPGSPDFFQRVEGIQEASPRPPASAIIEFVGELTRRYPEPTKEHPDSAWAESPILGDASGQFINIGVQWDHYQEVAPFIVATANNRGLSCYDPQNSRFYPTKKSN